MKNILFLILCSSTFFFNNSEAQITTRLGFQYGLPVQQATLQDYFEDPNGSYETANTPYTFGKGVWTNIGLAYDITPCFGIELGASYQLSQNTFTQLQVRNTPPSERQNTYTNKRLLLLSPSLRYECQTGKLKPYGRFGLLLPMNGTVDITEEGRGNDPILMQNYDYQSTATIKLKSAVGFTSAVGFSYELNDKFDIYLEGSGNFLNIKQDNKGLTSYLNRLQDRETLDELSLNQREFIYADNISAQDNQDPDQPSVLLQQAQPFSNFGLGLGLRFKIGNDKKPRIPNRGLLNPPVGMQEVEVCKKKHKVNVKSTMWIADMNLEKELIEYKASLDRRKVPEWKQKDRLALYTAFVVGTNTFPDDGSHAEPADSTKRKFRIASELDFDIQVVNGKIVTARAINQPKTRGGYEAPTIFGTTGSRVLHELAEPNKYTCRYIIYGDPHWLVEPSFNVLELRASTRIWHYIEVEIIPQPDCSIKKRVRFRASSAYPSHRLWLDDKEITYAQSRKSVEQGIMFRLWNSTKVDIEKKSRRTDLPANDFAFLLRFMGKDIKKWVRPRYNPTNLLEWPYK